MPANRLFRAKKREGEKMCKGTLFHYVLYQNPSSLSKADKETIVETFGNRMVKGEVCLDITATNVKRDLDNREYSAIAFVRNANMPEGAKDEGSGALQYYDWCEQGKPQLWVNDLCRVTELQKDQAKPVTSPIECLLLLLEDLAKEKHQEYLYLMVDHDKRDVLAPIYRKYGFDITQDCDFTESIIMRKPLPHSSKTRKHRR